MSDQLDFELKLSAAVKVFARNADAPFEPSAVVASALNRGRVGSSIQFPRLSTAVATGAIALVFVVAGAVTLNFFVNRQPGIGVASPSPSTAPASAAPTPTSTEPTPATPAPAPVRFGIPALTTTFVSPRNGFSIKHPEGVAITPATQLWGFSTQVDDGFDVVETGLGAVFKGASAGPEALGGDDSIDQQVDDWLADDNVVPGGCGVPRNQQAEIAIDGQPGRIAECENQIEATVIVGERLYLFTLPHRQRFEAGEARALFDAFAATIDLTPDAAVESIAWTITFVSPSYGYSFNQGRGGFEPATELWDPVNQRISIFDWDARLDGFETGYGAYFEAASTPIPDGVSIDAWVDEYITPPAAGSCGVPRSQQAEITIDGQPARMAQCDHSEATVVAGGRLYLFMGPHDDRDWFKAWIETIRLTPELATVP